MGEANEHWNSHRRKERKEKKGSKPADYSEVYRGGVTARKIAHRQIPRRLKKISLHSDRDKKTGK